MLDFSHPHSENILKASGYLDRIKMQCHQCAMLPFEERKAGFEYIHSLCEELIRFAKTAFPKEQESIGQLCDIIIAESQRLSAIDSLSSEGHCRICNAPLKSIPAYPQKGRLFYCNVCAKTIHDTLQKLEQVTGAWAI